MAVQISKEVSSKINNIYDQQKKAQLAQLQSARDNALRGLNQQKTETNQSAYSNRNQADVVNAQSVQRLREFMASRGLSSSGENVSGQIALGSARQNALNDINTSQQNALSDINNQIANVNDPGQQNSITADIEARRSQALLDAYQQAVADAQRQAAIRASASRAHSSYSGGGRSYSRSDSNSSPLASSYQQYQNEKSQYNSPTPRLDDYYMQMVKNVQPSGPRKNPYEDKNVLRYLSPQAPADNRNLSPWDKVNLLG